MRSIPQKLKKRLEQRFINKNCVVGIYHKGKYGACSGRIEWHHVWTYGGSQINEDWAILGACEGHHRAVKESKEVKEVFERESLNLATKGDLERYPKKDWQQIRRYLKAI